MSGSRGKGVRGQTEEAHKGGGHLDYRFRGNDGNVALTKKEAFFKVSEHYLDLFLSLCLRSVEGE